MSEDKKLRDLMLSNEKLEKKIEEQKGKIREAMRKKKQFKGS